MIAKKVVSSIGLEGYESVTDKMMNDDTVVKYLDDLSRGSMDTFIHSVNVASLAEKVGKKLKVHDLETLVTGALLHDIGKLFVPDYILNKPGALTDSEFDNIKLHPINGLFIIMSDFPKEVCAIVRDHHEKLDGTGYFYGQTDVSFETQIVTVCDMFEAMTHREIYKEKYSIADTMKLLYKDAELGKLNPIIVDALSRVIRSENKKVSDKIDMISRNK